MRTIASTVFLALLSLTLSSCGGDEADGGGCGAWGTSEMMEETSSADDFASGSVELSDGSVLMAGERDQDWIVRKFSDGTWSQIDLFEYLGSYPTTATDVTTGPTGEIYVVGYGFGPSASVHWLVRKSTDGGSSWTTKDDYTGPSGGNDAFGRAVHVTSNGDIYTAGSGNDGFSTHWIVRKSTDGGDNWTVVDDYELTSGAIARDITSDSSGNIYVAGGASGSSSTHWIVRKSSNDGASWTTVDDFEAESGQDSVARTVLATSTGALLAGGEGVRLGSEMYWIIRRSIDGGSTWTTVADDLGDGGLTSVYDFSENSAGEIYAAGEISEMVQSVGRGALLINKSTDGGATWSQEEKYRIGDFTGAFGRTVTAATNSSVFAGGGEEFGQWLVRAKLCE